MSAIMILSAINPAAYSGTPYGGTAPIVGTSGVLKIEAEDYDEGGEGVITGRSAGKTEVNVMLLSDGVLKERKIKVNVVDK